MKSDTHWGLVALRCSVVPLIVLLCMFPLVLASVEWVHQPAFAQGQARYQYVVGDIGQLVRVIDLHHDPSAARQLSISAPVRYEDVHLTVYRLHGEPIARFVLPRRVFEYFTIDSRQVDGGVSGSLRFEVPVDWLDSNRVHVSQIVLYWYDTATQRWVELPTVSGGVSNGKQVYDAVVKGLGNFAVGVLENHEVNRRIVEQERKELENVSLVLPIQPREELVSNESYAFIQQEQSSVDIGVFLIIGGIGGLVFLLVVWFVVRRRPGTPSGDIDQITQSIRALRAQVDEHPVHDMVHTTHQTLEQIERRVMASGDDTSARAALREFERHLEQLSPKVINQFVSKQRDRGVDDSHIGALLIDAGFDEHLVRNALASKIIKSDRTVES